MKTRQVNRLFSRMSAVLLSVPGVISVLAAGSFAQTIREVAVPGMRGIASVGYRGGDVTVEYNPRACNRLGPDLCSFFRAHEYGHIALRHLERGTPVRQAEYEADIWAAQNATPSARAEAIRYFRNGNGGSIAHGSAVARANRIASAGTSVQVRVTVRPDGSRVAKRSYNAISRRPFQHGTVWRVVRRQ